MHLSDVLALAGRGWHVFPLKGKRPLPGSRGLYDATTDASVITLRYEENPGCNWGISCGPSGLLVVDVDQHGCDGEQGLAGLLLEEGDLPQTFQVATPTGGRHIYLQGSGRSSAGTLAEGVDTRGEGGYVVAPGSAMDGKPYRVISDHPPAPAPAWLAERLAQRSEARTAPGPVEPDQMPAVLAAVDMLRRAPAAIEGQGGDLCTVRVAMRCRDLGVGQAMTLQLMLDQWNDRCCPPWEPGDLAIKVKNAFRYSQNDFGCDMSELVFQPVDENGQPELVTFDATAAADIDGAAIPTRRWVMGHRFIQGFVTVTVAAGGSGKSMLSTTEALALVSGKNLTGDKPYETGAVLIYNTEDPLDELMRRTWAAANHHGISGDCLKDLHVISGLDRPLKLVTPSSSGPQLDQVLYQSFRRFVQRLRLKLLIVDPFVETHGCDENDNTAVAAVVQAFRRLAVDCGIAVHLIHHTRKKSGGEAGAGDMDMSRGASSLASAARVVHTLVSMSEGEAAGWGLDPDDHRWYMRLDDAKANLSPPAEATRWFKKVSVELPNGQPGDHVGVAELANLAKLTDEDLRDKVAALLPALLESHGKSLTSQLVVDAVHDQTKLPKARCKRVLADLVGAEIGGWRVVKQGSKLGFAPAPEDVFSGD